MPRLASINKNRYHQLVGLLALADRHYDLISEIERAVVDLVDGEPYDVAGDSAHVGDMIWGSVGHNDADALLRKMNITVED